MSFAEIAVVLVSVAFLGLVVWVYRPGRRADFERHGEIPFDDEPPSKQPCEEPR